MALSRAAFETRDVCRTPGVKNFSASAKVEGKGAWGFWGVEKENDDYNLTP